MDFRLAAGKITNSLTQDGVLMTIRRTFAYFQRRRVIDEFDMKYGVDTGGIDPLWKFTIRSPNARFGVRHQATSEQELADAVSCLNEDPHSFVFIDLGCGKGKTLLVASKLGFRRVIGVEFALELAEIATANLAKIRATEASVVHEDAADFQFPDCNFVVYLHNPFSQEVMSRVMANLSKSRAKKIFVIYSDPQCAALLDSCGFLSRFGCPVGRNIPIWTSAN